MDTVKMKCKRVWGRCRRGHGSYKSLGKSEGWEPTPENDESQKKKRQVAPQGCFSVYVGPERERFVIKIQIANHPLFKMLLDDAENEYGFRNEGPICLPCDVDMFCEAVAEMESSMEEDMISFGGCSFPKSHSSSVMQSPLSYCSNHSCAADYELLSPSGSRVST